MHSARSSETGYAYVVTLVNKYINMNDTLAGWQKPLPFPNGIKNQRNINDTIVLLKSRNLISEKGILFLIMAESSIFKVEQTQAGGLTLNK